MSKSEITQYFLRRWLDAWDDWIGVYLEPTTQEWTGRCGICGKLPCDYHGHYPIPVGEV